MNFDKFIKRIGPSKAAEPEEQEVNLAEEANATVSDFRKDMAREKASMKLANDTEFWCALVFETRDQKDAFLEAVKLARLGDKYVNGVRLAESIGIKLPAGPKFRKLKTATPKLKALL